MEFIPQIGFSCKIGALFDLCLSSAISNITAKINHRHLQVCPASLSYKMFLWSMCLPGTCFLRVRWEGEKFHIWYQKSVNSLSFKVIRVTSKKIQEPIFHSTSLATSYIVIINEMPVSKIYCICKSSNVFSCCLPRHLDRK